MSKLEQLGVEHTDQWIRDRRSRELSDDPEAEDGNEPQPLTRNELKDMLLRSRGKNKKGEK